MKAHCPSPEERYQLCIRIDELVAKMEGLAEVGGEGSRVRPDHTLRGTAISAWAQCANLFRERRKKENHGRRSGDGSKEDRKWAASCAERACDHLLVAVEEWKRWGGSKTNNTNNGPCLPNIHTFNDVINAYGCVLHPEQASEVFQLASDLQPTIQPDLIDAFVDCASINVNAASRAEVLLTEMVGKYSEEGTASVKPNRQAYNSVLAGWGCSSDPNSADHAHYLLTRLVDNYEKDLQQGENKE